MSRKIIYRLKILKFLLILLSVIIIWKLFYIQVIKGNEFKRIADSQHQKEIDIPAKRGNIYDREMRILSQDLEYYSFGCYPDKVENPVKVANIFAKHLGEKRDTYLRKIRENKNFVWLKRKVEKKIGDKIWENNMKGVTKTIDYSRFYSYSNTACQVVGFTDIDNNGLTGIENQYNDDLQGKDGKSILKVDAMGRIFPDPGYLYKPPQNGSSLILTLDLICQTIAEEELKRAIYESEAKSGMVVIMYPKGGEILAMASFPDFNPNSPLKFNTYNYRNRVIADTFEPGSTFKIVTASAILEENIKKYNDIIFCENGKIKIYNHTIRDVKSYGNLTFQEVIEKSSNIGTLKCAMLLGKRKLYSYARDFGFGNESGLGLIGEASGKLRKPAIWSNLSLPEIAIGQEVAITAIQLINAYAAIANNGILMKPRIIKAIVDNKGKIIEKTNPEEIRRIISEETANTLKSFLIGVVEKGTGINAKVDGIKIAGKTGTAQKSLSDRPGYSRTDVISSFVGFWPADEPEFVCLIVIDTPRKGHYSSTTTAPAFRNIVQRISNIPSRNSKIVWKNNKYTNNKKLVNSVRLPDVRNLTIDVAKKKLKIFKDFIEISGNGSIVSSQEPSPGKYLKEGEKITLICEDKPIKVENKVITPNLIGLSLRKAINDIQLNKLKFKVTYGNGIVVEQSPLPGKKVNIGTVCYVRCSDNKNISRTIAYK